MSKFQTSIQTTNTNTNTSSQSIAWTIAQAADDRKAADIVLLDVSEVSYLTEYFVVATGFSNTQMRAIADAVEEKMLSTFGREPIRIEGKADANWILIDYGEVIAHLFLPNTREFYNLEAFWGHAEKTDFVSPNSRS